VQDVVTFAEGIKRQRQDERESEEDKFYGMTPDEINAYVEEHAQPAT
jgi:hypothetical protein